MTAFAASLASVPGGNGAKTQLLAMAFATRFRASTSCGASSPPRR
jgi:putative Ca2+/H+ antiporter (TMEM165/GDT1 family)